MPSTKPTETTCDEGATTQARVGTEREIKLAGFPGFELPDLTGAVPGVVAVRTATLELDAVYHDTDDLRLARRGVTLRRRTGEGSPRWTLKFPAGPRDEAVLGRREIDMPDAGGPSDRPPLLEDLVTAYVRSATVGPVARLRSVRGRVELRADDGATLAEIDDDEVTVIDDDDVVASFREVELEFGESASQDLVSTVVERLRAAGAGAPDPTPKLVRALGPRALAPPELVRVELDSQAAIGALLQAGLTNDACLVLDHDHVVRLDEGLEGVHRARVGTRRLRSNLKTFSALLEPTWAVPLRDGLRWLGEALGEVRDADVLLAVLRADLAAFRVESDRQAGVSLLGRLERERAAALGELLNVMGSTRYVVLLDRLVEVANAPAFTPEAEIAASDIAPRLVLRLWRKLRAAVRALDEHPGDDELHTIRILAKRVRYAAEVALPVVANEAAEFVDAVTALQDELGTLHDAVIAQRWLRAASAGSSPAETLVAGELLVRCEDRAQRCREEWQIAWHDTDRKRLTRWMQ